MEKIQEKKFTRWQLRVGPELEKAIRNMAEKDQRSINKTIIVLIEIALKKRPPNS
jgi:hypothetical protein